MIYPKEKNATAEDWSMEVVTRKALPESFSSRTPALKNHTPLFF
jgi:hypothetical protein